MSLSNLNKICKSFWFLIIIANFIPLAIAKNKTASNTLRIGVVFDEEKAEGYSAFNFAQADLANYSLEEHGIQMELTPHIDFMESSAVSSCHISQYVQTQVLRSGTLAVLCALTNPSQIYRFLSDTNRLQLPFVAPRTPITLVADDVGFGVRLQPAGMQDALLDMIAHYGYKHFIYMYKGYEGLQGLQSFHNRLNAGADSMRIAIAKKFSDAAQALEILEHIESSYRWTFKLIVMDCPVALAKKVLLAHVADRSLGRRTYHYLLAGFAFDEYWDPEDLVKVSHLNITGFRIVNPERPFVRKYLARVAELENKNETNLQPILTASGAFIYDCVLVLQEGFARLFSKEILAQNSSSNMEKSNHTDKKQHQLVAERALHNLKYRKQVLSELRNVKIEGLTGAIRFARGVRVNYSLDVIEVGIKGDLRRIGDWVDGMGFTGNQEVKQEEQRPYVVTSLLDEPFLMKQPVPPGQPEPEGNDLYYGFAKDLIDNIATRLNITYILQIAKDGTHGKKNDSVPGGWDGIVGSLVRMEADLAVAQLTANAEREEAIQLSKPFMFVGISIMLYKSAGQIDGISADGIYTDVFEFMRPLSRETWMCVGISYVAVCIVLYAIAKFNKKELETVERHGLVKVRPQFSASNSLWFTFASLVSQGTNISPRSLACRLVGSVWWFFTLILISSYTANFAAFQTVNRMVQPINSASDLVSQKKVGYGLLEGGATEDFFKKSRIRDYQKMYAYMTSGKAANVRSYDDGIAKVRREQGKYAFLLESLKNDYVSRRMPCDTMRVGGNLDTHSFSIGLSRKTTLNMKDISALILEFRGSGLLEDLQNKWWPPHINECEGMDENVPKEERGRLSLKKLAGVFYVLIGGIVIALLIALFEIWWKSRGRGKAHPSAENLKSSPKSGSDQIRFGELKQFPLDE